MGQRDTKDAMSDPTVPVPTAMWFRRPAVMLYYSAQVLSISLGLTYPPMFLHRKHPPYVFINIAPTPYMCIIRKTVHT